MTSMTVDPPPHYQQQQQRAAVAAVANGSSNSNKQKEEQQDIEKCLQQFKQNIADEKFLCEHDDRFLLTFLRTKRYDLAQAQKLLRCYDDFRRRYSAQPSSSSSSSSSSATSSKTSKSSAASSTNWLLVSRSEWRAVLASGVIDLLEWRDSRSRRVLWLRAGRWQVGKHTADTCLKMGGLIAELALYEETAVQESSPSPSAESGQVGPSSGCVAVIDMHGFTMGQLAHVTPTFVRKLMHYLVSCLPMRIFTAHVIRESGGFAVVFALFRKFIDDRMKKRIFFHGHDMSSLAKSVESCSLPLELGGSTPHDADPTRWDRLLDDQRVRREMEKLGYTFIED